LARLTFLGVGDAVHPTGGSTSLLYQGAQTWLIDCGPAIANIAFRALGDPNALDAIWVSHQHADHCFGLPTLLLMLRLARRSKSLNVFGGPGAVAIVRDLLELGYPGAFRANKCFPIHFREIRPDQTFDAHGLRVTTARTHHSVACYALRIDEADHAFCFSGDGHASPASLELYRDANLVVHECQSAETANANHCRVADLEALFAIANVSQVALVHCSKRERSAIAERSRVLYGKRAFVPEAGDSLQIG
jgi:ribonuclease BN (tRNA processing enzyme)